jgi:hypothetical protein
MLVKRLLAIIAVVPVIGLAAGVVAVAYGYAVTVGLKRGLSAIQASAR